MKTLTILRHAKSSWDDSSLDDFSRPLNDRGRKAAAAIGRALRKRGLTFDLVLASPATRVRETLERFAEGYGKRGEVRFDERIYMASAGTLLAVVRELPDNVVSTLLVGHNPGLQQLVLMLAGGDAHDLERVGEKFPTAAVATVELPAVRWSDIEAGSGQIVALIRPRELDD